MSAEEEEMAAMNQQNNHENMGEVQHEGVGAGLEEVGENGEAQQTQVKKKKKKKKKKKPANYNEGETEMVGSPELREDGGGNQQRGGSPDGVDGLDSVETNEAQ